MPPDRPRYGVLAKALKAFEQPHHDRAYVGDIRPTVDLPAGTVIDDITEFEVFDGRSWRKPSEFE